MKMKSCSNPFYEVTTRIQRIRVFENYLIDTKFKEEYLKND